MKEKYIFFTLLIIAAVMMIGSGIGTKAKAEISAQERVLEKRLKRAATRQIAVAEKIDMDEVQNLVAFSYYEGMLRRSPFIKVQPKRARAAKREAPPVPVEEQTPVFLYKGKISAGSRLMVIIKQTRSGETFMVSSGESIDGYKVLDITDTEVILSKKGEEDIVLKTTERP